MRVDMAYRRRTYGFTIVELLIVIVVIAILAAITVVSFNGIQKRAQTTQYAAAADAVIKALKLYQVDKSFSELYTQLGGNGSDDIQFCFAKTVDLPAIDGFGTGECMLPASPAITANDTAIGVLYAHNVSSYKPMNLPVVTLDIPSQTYKTRGVIVDIWPGDAGVDVTWYTPDSTSCGQGRDGPGGFLDKIKAIIDSGTTEGTVYSYMTISELEDSYSALIGMYIDVYGSIDIVRRVCMVHLR